MFQRFTNIITRKKTPSNPSNLNENNPSKINGLHLGTHYMPEELLTLILSHVSPATLPGLRLVCKEWNNIIKSSSLWIEIFKRNYPRREIKTLPWYIYYVFLSTDFFDTNLIKSPRDSPKNWEFHKGPIKMKRPFECVQFHDEYFINLTVRQIYSHILKKYKPDIIVEASSCADISFIGIDMLGTKTETSYCKLSDFRKISENQSKVCYIIENYKDDMEQLCFTVNIGNEGIFALKILFDSIKV